MSIVVIGVNHRTRAAVGPRAGGDRARRRGQGRRRPRRPGTTCARSPCSARATASRSTPSPSASTAPTPTSATSSASSASLAADDLHPYLYSQHDDAAARHLFEVAAGLDSAVLGESEILGQVRAAWQVASDEGGVRSTLDLLFRHALRVGKRARTETAIGRGTDVDQPRRGRDGHRPPRLAGRAQRARRRRRRDGRRRGHRAAPGRRRRDHRRATARPSAAPRWPSASAARALGLDRVGEAVADVRRRRRLHGVRAERRHPPGRRRTTARPTDPLLIVDIAVPRSVDRAVGSASPA